MRLDLNCREREAWHEALIFQGTHQSYGNLMVAPELPEYVRCEVERDARLAKNVRKSRDERDALNKKPKGGKGEKGKKLTLK